MKAEDINIAIEAVNKFIFYGWNFTAAEFSYKSYNGKIVTMWVPRFITEVKWDCPTLHMAEKWNGICNRDCDLDARMIRFYAELGDSNRRHLIEYVMKNYNGERKII